MAVPPFQDLFLPFLTFIADGGEYERQTVADHLEAAFSLSPEDTGEILPSGRQTRFMNRVAWTRTYLGKALLLEPVGRGRFRITQRGLDLLATNPKRVDNRTLKQYDEFQSFHQAAGRDTKGSGDEQLPTIETPEERLEASYQALRKELVQALLQQIYNTSPAFFEQLVVDILVAMGYGGSGSTPEMRWGKAATKASTASSRKTVLASISFICRRSVGKTQSDALMFKHSSVA